MKAEPVEVDEMLIAGIGEGKAEIDETGGKIFKRDRDLFPLVPITGGLELSGCNFLAVCGDCGGGTAASRGITEGHFPGAIESKAMVFGPVGMINCSDEAMVFPVKNLGAVVGGVGFGLDGSGMEPD